MLPPLFEGATGSGRCEPGPVPEAPALPAPSGEAVRVRLADLAHGRSGDKGDTCNIGLFALNFLLHESLGGGGTLSLHLDAQGKTYSHALLSCEVEIDRAWAELAGWGE